MCGNLSHAFNSRRSCGMLKSDIVRSSPTLTTVTDPQVHMLFSTKVVILLCMEILTVTETHMFA